MAKPIIQRQNKVQKLAGKAFTPVKALEVSSFCDDNDGLRPTEVHLQIRWKDGSPPMVMAFKSPEYLDSAIDALRKGRAHVFGPDDLSPAADTGERPS